MRRILGLTLLSAMLACQANSPEHSQQGNGAGAGDDGGQNPLTPPVSDAGTSMKPSDAGSQATDTDGGDAARSDASVPGDAATNESDGSVSDADAGAQPPPSSRDFMHGRYGIGFHYLQDWLGETKNGGSAEWNAAVDSFDVEGFADAAKTTGATWVLFTLGQNSGYYIAPNAALGKYSGYAAGERCANRDLPLALGKALAKRDLKLMLYLPSNAPAHDAQTANGLGETVLDGGNWTPTEEFVTKWAEVIGEWSQRYGTYVAGWWFDGYYAPFAKHKEWARMYRDAARSGNPDSQVAFNRGLSFFVPPAPEYQDYLAGETGANGIDDRTCTDGTIDGVLCHVFVPFGGWSGGKPRNTAQRILDYTNAQLGVNAAITWNLGVSEAGVITQSHLEVFAEIKSDIKARP